MKRPTPPGPHFTADVLGHVCTGDQGLGVETGARPAVTGARRRPAKDRSTESAEINMKSNPTVDANLEKIVSKMQAYVGDVLGAIQEDPATAAVWTEKVSGWHRDLVLAGLNSRSVLRWGEFPVAALHRLDQVMDDPNLSLMGKLTAMREVLLQGLEGTVACH